MIVDHFKFFFILLVCVNAQTLYYATPVDGAEVIDFPSTTTLSYASNLKMDLNNTSNDVYTIYFSAGRRVSNIYTAQFQPNPTNEKNKFWSTGVPISTSASPFLTFDILGNNIIGPAFPSNLTHISSFVIQSIYLGSQTYVREYNITGLTIVSTIISPTTDSGTGNNYVYLAGWDNNPNSNFVVARATMKTNQPDPSFQINLEKDVLTIPPADFPCYDQYDEVSHPQMYLKRDQLFVLIPKRCSLFVLINLPSDTLTPFNSLHPQVYSPAPTNEIYVSSAVFDPIDSMIYYTLKTYHSPGAKLCYFDSKSWTPNNNEYDLELLEAENLLVLGTDSPSLKYLFIIASGANKVQRLSVASNYTFYAPTAAAISPAINRISSAWYFRPALYFTTYEPDAKVGRLIKQNFCKDWCGDFGYCTIGYCSCRTGYSFDGSDPKNLCVLSSYENEKNKEQETQGAAAALGVLFAFCLLGAMAGWIMWWRSRKLQRLPGSF